MKKRIVGIGIGLAAATLMLVSAQDGGTLKILGFKAGTELGPIPALNERFTKETGIKVEYEAISDASGYTSVLKTRVAGGDAPDVFMSHGKDDAKIYAAAGNMLDLTAEPWVKTLTSSANSVAKVSGKVVVLPFEFASIGLLFNQALLNEAGVKTIPQTYAQFTAALRTIKAKGKTALLVPGKDGWAFVTSLLMATDLWRTNPDLTDDMLAGKVKFSSAGWRKVFSNLASLGKLGLIDPTLNLGVDNNLALNEFIAGRVAFLVHGSWQVGSVKKTNPNLKFGFMGFPSGPTNTKASGVVLAGGAWGISSKSKQTDAARKYLAFWAKEKNLNDWLTSANAFSPLKGGVVDLPDEMKPFSDAAADDRTVNFPFSDWPAGFQGAFVTATVDAMQGKDLTKTLKTLDQEFAKK
jgi:raffinose/stachyose/melibiose transport system substrate-binding protein